MRGSHCMSISHHVISCEVQYLVRMLWTLQLSLGYRDNFMSFHILANMSSTFTLLTKRRSAIIAVLRCRHCTHYIDINISVSTCVWGGEGVQCLKNAPPHSSHMTTSPQATFLRSPSPPPPPPPPFAILTEDEKLSMILIN
jgi:hypothetical protein